MNKIILKNKNQAKIITSININDQLVGIKLLITDMYSIIHKIAKKYKYFKIIFIKINYILNYQWIAAAMIMAIERKNHANITPSAIFWSSINSLWSDHFQPVHFETI